MAKDLLTILMTVAIGLGSVTGCQANATSGAGDANVRRISVDDYADRIARQVWDLVYDVFKESPLDRNRKGTRPEPYSIALHNFFGYITGALPTGRNAGEALTDASVSPMPGTDLNGPTALAKSAASAMDVVKHGTNHLNMRFHPSSLEGVKGAKSLINATHKFCCSGFPSP